MLQSSPAASRAIGAASALPTGDKWRNALPMTPGLAGVPAVSPCGAADAMTGAGLACSAAAVGTVLGTAAVWVGVVAITVAAGVTAAITGRAAACPLPRSAKP